jgi:hypothetical protein
MTTLLTLTTTPIEITDGMEQLLNPFKKVKLPVHELALMMSISLRFRAFKGADKQRDKQRNNRFDSVFHRAACKVRTPRHLRLHDFICLFHQCRDKSVSFTLSL